MFMLVHVITALHRDTMILGQGFQLIELLKVFEKVNA